MQIEYQQHEDLHHFKKLVNIMRKSCQKLTDKTKFPKKISELETIYRQFLRETVMGELQADCADILANMKEQQLNHIMDQYILSEAKLKNYVAADDIICDCVDKFLTKLNFFSSFEEASSQKFIGDYIDESDKVLIEILQENDQLKTKQYNLFKFYTFNKDQTGGDQEENLSILNERMQTIYMIINIYQQAVFFKYEMSDFYYSRDVDMRTRMMQKIFKKADEKYPKIISRVDKALKKNYKKCMEEFENIAKQSLEQFQELNETLSVNQFIESYNTTQTYIRDTFLENVKADLGGLKLNDVIMFKYTRRIKNHIKNSLIYEQLNKEFLSDKRFLGFTIECEIKGMIESYQKKASIKKLFDEKILNGKQNLCSLLKIVLLTDLGELTLEKYEYYFELLENFFLKYCLELNEEQPELSYCYSLINSYSKYRENISNRRALLEQEIKLWEKKANLSINLYAMLSVFIHFVGEGSEIAYKASKRYLMKQIFRNLLDGKYKFTNFQILCVFEKLHVNYFPDEINQEKEKNTCLLASYQTLQKIRQTKIGSFEEHQSNVDQLIPVKPFINGYIKTPKKFFLEKISESAVKSRSIIITVAGFTSEDFNKAEIYKGVLEQYPNSEILSLNWSSNTMSQIYKVVTKEAKTMIAANSVYFLGLEFGAAYRFLSLAITGLSSYKTIKKDVWSTTFEESIITGVYLAHLIADTDIFKNYSVSLAGFSLGTMVIINCLWELQRMKRFDLIYDCLFLGGVVDISDFGKETIDVVTNNVMSTYSKKDLILRMLLKTVDFGVEPIGVSQINSLDNKIKNLDVTKLVGGHLDYRDNMFKILNRVDFNEDREHYFAER